MEMRKAGDGNRTHTTSLEGWEATDINECKPNHLGSDPIQLTAPGTAHLTKNNQFDPDLSLLLQLWPKLPSPIKESIIIIAKNTLKGKI